MNLSRKNIVLSIGGAVLALIVAASAILLYRGIRQFGEAERQLKRAEVALKKLYAKDPFPSEENIRRERENVDVLRQWYKSLIDELAQGQVPEVQKSPTAFMNLLSERNNRLLVLARKNGVGLPENFSFGFARYAAEGNLPPPPEVPRLTQQLIMIENIGTILIEAGVKRIEQVRRDEFEQRAASRTARPGGPGGPGGAPRPLGRPGMGAPGGGVAPMGVAGADMSREDTELYTRQHFTWEFAATEKALHTVLNELATHPMFIVVTSLDLTKPRPDVREAAAVTAGESVGRLDAEGNVVASESDAYTSRRQRLVSGPQLEVPMTVQMAMDVYLFKGE